MAKERPIILSCYTQGGRSPVTGKPVGTRHRWSGGKWGEGTCDFCHKTLEQVKYRPAKK